jgi:hypothetical protein
MKTVWKFPIALEARQQIRLPAGAEILNVQVQRDVPQLWVLVDTERPGVLREFMLVGTGHEIESDGTYLGTFLNRAGDLVLHLFECQP